MNGSGAWVPVAPLSTATPHFAALHSGVSATIGV
jgi:hypothetical protein